jgi:fucose permease
MRKLMTNLMNKIDYEAAVVLALVACVVTVAVTWLHAFSHFG